MGIQLHKQNCDRVHVYGLEVMGLNHGQECIVLLLKSYLNKNMDCQYISLSESPCVMW